MTKFWMYSFDGMKSTDDFAERELFPTREKAEAAAMQESLKTGADLNRCSYYYVVSKESNFVKPEPMGLNIGDLVDGLISDVSDMPEFMALTPERKAEARRALDLRVAEMLSNWIFEELGSKRAVISMFESLYVVPGDDDEEDEESLWQ